MRVVGAEVNPAFITVRRGLDLIFRFEGPFCFPGSSVHGMQNPVQVADEDGSFENTGRRLLYGIPGGITPEEFSVRQRDGVKRAVHGSEVGRSVANRG